MATLTSWNGSVDDSDYDLLIDEMERGIALCKWQCEKPCWAWPQCVGPWRARLRRQHLEKGER